MAIKTRISLSALLLLGVSLRTADAQTNAQQAGGEVRTQHVAQLSGPDQLRETGTVIDSITNARRTVSDLLDRARQENDIIKVGCLNDKLTQIDVTLRSAREHQELLQSAVSINNDGQRNHEFQLINIYRGRAQTLTEEARQCLGEDTGTFDQSSRVSVVVNPDIAEQDTTTLTPDMIMPDRPLVMSPVM